MKSKANPLEADVLKIFEIQMKMSSPEVKKPWHEVDSSDQIYLQETITELSVALEHIHCSSANETLHAIKRFCDLINKIHTDAPAQEAASSGDEAALDATPQRLAADIVQEDRKSESEPKSMEEIIAKIQEANGIQD